MINNSILKSIGTKTLASILLLASSFTFADYGDFITEKPVVLERSNGQHIESTSLKKCLYQSSTDIETEVIVKSDYTCPEKITAGVPSTAQQAVAPNATPSM